MESFIEFLVTKFRPTKTGKPGNVGQFSCNFSAEQNKSAIGKSVIISTNKDLTKILVHTKTPLSKKYLKFLTKKFLSKQSLRDIVRVNSDPRRKEITMKFYAAIGNDIDALATPSEDVE